MTNDLAIAAILAGMALLASLVSIRIGITVAIIEIMLGIIAGNAFAIQATPWIDFLGSFAGILLTFLAGAEVDHAAMRREWKPVVLIGGASFLVPFAGVALFAAAIAGWNTSQAILAGIALSATSIAVVYMVLAETGLAAHRIGKILMGATFVTNLGSALALTVLFARPDLALFAAVSAGVIGAAILLKRPFFARFGGRVIEPGIRSAFFALFVLMWVADITNSHAALPAFLLGFALAPAFKRHPEEKSRLSAVAFSFLTPIFFFKSGINVSIDHLAGEAWLPLAFLAVVIATKFAAVLPLARRHVRPHAMFTTLLMSTGLTFGTLSALYGLNAGIIDRGQFTTLIAAMVGSVVLPTLIAQRFFPQPPCDDPP
jgi:Kef-type K+ transport system membrane component KefB